MSESTSTSVTGVFESISFLMERCSNEEIEKIAELAKSKLGKSESTTEKVLELLEQVSDEAELEKVERSVSEKLNASRGDKSFGAECAKKCALQKGEYYKGLIDKGIQECYNNRSADHEFKVCPDVRDLVIKHLKDLGIDAWEGYYDSDVKMKIVPDRDTLLKCLNKKE